MFILKFLLGIGLLGKTWYSLLNTLFTFTPKTNCFLFVFIGFYITSDNISVIAPHLANYKWRKTPETRLSCTDGQLGRTTDLPQASRKASSHIKISPLARLEPTAVRDQGISSRRL